MMMGFLVFFFFCVQIGQRVPLFVFSVAMNKKDLLVVIVTVVRLDLERSNLIGEKYDSTTTRYTGDFDVDIITGMTLITALVFRNTAVPILTVSTIGVE
jgi:hypothetical protein